MSKWVPQPDGASPVIMVRSLPAKTSEQELHKWGESFSYRAANGAAGSTRVVKALVLQDRMLGFVQFVDIEMARAVMAQFMANPPSIVIAKNGESYLLNLVYSDKPEIRSQNRGRMSPSPAPVYANARLLLVVLKDLKGTISIDELFWVFTQVARVEKVSSFIKDQKNQIVVQFETAEGASKALDYFNGKRLPQYHPDGSLATGDDDQGADKGLCFFAIVPSKLPELTFRNQDARNRDYTEVNRMLESLTSSPGAMSLSKSAVMLEWGALLASSNMSVRDEHPLYDFIWGEPRWGGGWLVPRQEAAYHNRLPPPSENGGVAASQGNVGECLHVSGLPHDDSIAAGHLWKLCGMYGNIKAVKMLYKYRGCAVVQFGSNEECKTAIKYLHGLDFQGRIWDVKISRQPNATHWNGASDDLQKRMVSANDPGIHPPPRRAESLAHPSNVMHVYDLPEGLCEKGVRAAVVHADGVKPPGSVEVDAAARTAVVSFATVNHGILAAVHLNGATIPAGVAGATPWTFKAFFGECTSPRGSRRGKAGSPRNKDKQSPRDKKGSAFDKSPLSPPGSKPNSPPTRAQPGPGAAQQHHINNNNAYNKQTNNAFFNTHQPDPAAQLADDKLRAAQQSSMQAQAQASALAQQNAMLMAQMGQMQSHMAAAAFGLGGSPLGPPGLLNPGVPDLTANVALQAQLQQQLLASRAYQNQQQQQIDLIQTIISNSPVAAAPPAVAGGGFADRVEDNVIDSLAAAAGPQVAMRSKESTPLPGPSKGPKHIDVGRDTFGSSLPAPAAVEAALSADLNDDDLVHLNSGSSPATPLSTRRRLKPPGVPGLRGPTQNSGAEAAPPLSAAVASLARPALTPTLSPTCSPSLYERGAQQPHTTIGFVPDDDFAHTPAAGEGDDETHAKFGFASLTPK